MSHQQVEGNLPCYHISILESSSSVTRPRASPFICYHVDTDLTNFLPPRRSIASCHPPTPFTVASKRGSSGSSSPLVVCFHFPTGSLIRHLRIWCCKKVTLFTGLLQRRFIRLLREKKEKKTKNRHRKGISQRPLHWHAPPASRDVAAGSAASSLLPFQLCFFLSLLWGSEVLQTGGFSRKITFFFMFCYLT